MARLHRPHCLEVSLPFFTSILNRLSARRAAVVGIECNGFVYAAPVALALGVRTILQPHRPGKTLEWLVCPRKVNTGEMRPETPYTSVGGHLSHMPPTPGRTGRTPDQDPATPTAFCRMRVHSHAQSTSLSSKHGLVFPVDVHLFECPARPTLLDPLQVPFVPFRKPGKLPCESAPASNAHPHLISLPLARSLYPRSLAPSRLQHNSCQHTPNPAVSHALTDHRNAGKSIGVDFKMASGIGAPAFGKDRLEMHEDALRSGAKVLIIDDMLGTGTTPLFPPSSSTEGTNPSLALCSALARRCVPSISSPPASNFDEIASQDRFRLCRNPKALIPNRRRYPIGRVRARGKGGGDRSRVRLRGGARWAGGEAEAGGTQGVHSHRRLYARAHGPGGDYWFSLRMKNGRVSSLFCSSQGVTWWYFAALNVAAAT